MKDQTIQQAINAKGLQGELIQLQSNSVTKTEISVQVMTANSLQINYSTLDFINPEAFNCQVVIWKDAVTPPYGAMEEKRVFSQWVPRNTSQGEFEIQCTNQDVNFYDDNYCIGFCMGQKMTSVCAFASLVGGAMVTNFESSIFVLNATTRQVAVHFSTPINNNPSLNHQFIDLYEADAYPSSSNCLSVRPLMGQYQDGQIVLQVKEGSALKRGQRYKVMFDFNTDYRSYGCEYYFTVAR